MVEKGREKSRLSIFMDPEDIKVSRAELGFFLGYGGRRMV